MLLIDSKPCSTLEILSCSQPGLNIHGLQKGAIIHVLKKPLGMPMQILVRGVKIGLRASDAKKITVKVIKE